MTLKAESQPELAFAVDLEARKEELKEEMSFFFKHRMPPRSNDLVIFLKRKWEGWDQRLLREVVRSFPELFKISGEAPSLAGGRSPPLPKKEKFQVMLSLVDPPVFIDVDAANASLDVYELNGPFQEVANYLRQPEDWHSWADKTNRELALAEELVNGKFPKLTLGAMRLIVKEALRREVIGRRRVGNGKGQKQLLVPFKESDSCRKSDSSQESESCPEQKTQTPTVPALEGPSDTHLGKHAKEGDDRKKRPRWADVSESDEDEDLGPWRLPFASTGAALQRGAASHTERLPFHGR